MLFGVFIIRPDVTFRRRNLTGSLSNHLECAPISTTFVIFLLRFSKSGNNLG